MPKDAIAAFCREHGIKRLAVFGSALRADFRPGSDIDLLVEFEPDRVPGLSFGIARMERELSVLLGGRKIDLRTPQDFEPVFPSASLRRGRGPICGRMTVSGSAICWMPHAKPLNSVRGRTRADLNSDRQLVLALVKAIEILGEAAYQVTPGMP